jgi:hypothetical protein
MQNIFLKTSQSSKATQEISFCKYYCEGIGAEHISLLFCCEARWLYRNNTLTYIFEWRSGSSPHVTEERLSAAHRILNYDFIIIISMFMKD